LIAIEAAMGAARAQTRRLIMATIGTFTKSEPISMDVRGRMMAVSLRKMPLAGQFQPRSRTRGAYCALDRRPDSHWIDGAGG
jgi:hypothetical protein